MSKEEIIARMRWRIGNLLNKNGPMILDEYYAQVTEIIMDTVEEAVGETR